MTAEVTGLPHAAMRAAVLKALLDEVKTAYEQARTEATSELRKVHGTLGVRTIEVRLPDAREPVAQLTLNSASVKLNVDEDALLAYCIREHPSEVQDIPATKQVRPAWRTALLSRLVVLDDGTVADPGTGRVLEFVTVADAGPPGVTMTFKTSGRDTIAAAHRDGRLSLPELLRQVTG